MHRLMIADTSDVVRKVARRILSELGFTVIDVADAQDALVGCLAELPEWLIVDAGMKGALELIASIRSIQGGKAVKIYYCVIESDLKTLMAGKRAGATDFLLKPFNRKILTSVFGNLSAAA